MNIMRTLPRLLSDTGQKKTPDKKDGRRMSFQRPKGTIEYSLQTGFFPKPYIGRGIDNQPVLLQLMISAVHWEVVTEPSGLAPDPVDNWHQAEPKSAICATLWGCHWL
ncbi:oxidation resistance protein 1 isoform X5 [Tachysurus ichikawai]